MKKKTKKIIIISACSLVGALLLTVLSYLLYVVCSYYRVEDNLALSVSGDAAELIPAGEELSLVTYNVGFGAYSKDYSFFMDGGEHSRAYSKDEVLKNIRGALEAVKSQDPDMILVQELDIDGDRSYHVDQSAIFAHGLSGYDSVFAQNYDSPYFFYPFSEPIGANRSGLMTLSRYNIESSVRRSFPIEDSLYKYLDLDRAYTVSVLEVDNGKKLILYNVHLSAYTSDGTIADEQLKMLCADMQEQYEKGNYVIAGGDFNKDLLGDSGEYFERPETDEYTWAQPLSFGMLPPGIDCHTGRNLPTCRNADSAFRGDGTDFILSVDGFLVSDNISVKLCETVDVGFEYSDHNPVLLEFVLKK